MAIGKIGGFVMSEKWKHEWEETNEYYSSKCRGKQSLHIQTPNTSHHLAPFFSFLKNEIHNNKTRDVLKLFTKMMGI
jgi:hypothetical protein